MKLRTLDSLPCIPLPAEGQGMTPNAAENMSTDEPPKAPEGSQPRPTLQPLQEVLNGRSLADWHDVEDMALGLRESDMLFPFCHSVDRVGRACGQVTPWFSSSIKQGHHLAGQL